MTKVTVKNEVSAARYLEVWSRSATIPVLIEPGAEMEFTLFEYDRLTVAEGDTVENVETKQVDAPHPVAEWR
jgi:hypothetical protein